MSTLPLSAAKNRGVAPSSFALSGSAPALIKRFANARSSRYAAQCKAVAPSACSPFTFTPSDSKAWTASESCARLAAISDSISVLARTTAFQVRPARSREIQALRRVVKTIPFAVITSPPRAMLP